MTLLAAGPFGLGPLEIGIILAVIVLLFGVGKLSGLGADLGRGIREFRKNVKDDDASPSGSPSARADAGDVAYCNQCGTGNKRGSRFCSECGQEMGAAVS